MLKINLKNIILVEMKENNKFKNNLKKKKNLQNKENQMKVMSITLKQRL